MRLSTGEHNRFHPKVMDKLIRKIEGLVDRPRRRHGLLKNRPLWYQLWTSLYALEDTHLAVAAYSGEEFGTSHGARYLAVYGLLQALFLQQDAAQNLCQALGMPVTLDEYPRLKEIRETRTESIGHPTKRERGKKGQRTSYHSITRMSLRPEGFDLLSQYSDGRLESKKVSIPDLVTDQRHYVVDILERIVCKLEDEEAAHKEKFRMEKLTAVFPSTLDYHLQKVLLCTTTGEDAALGEAHLQEIKGALDAFREALARRGIELDTYESIRDVYQSLEYPLGELQRFFDTVKAGGRPHIDPRAADIFAWYVQRQVCELKKMAREIDQDYAS